MPSIVYGIKMTNTPLFTAPELLPKRLLEAFPPGVALLGTLSQSRLFGSISDAHPLNIVDRPGIKSIQIRINGHVVNIPSRVYLEQTNLSQGQLTQTSEDMLAMCLCTRSENGYIRQAALMQILPLNQPWSIPFVVALVGEYVIEILQDIQNNYAMIDTKILRKFLVENPQFWILTKARIISYWDCYYRQLYPIRQDYPGFQIIEQFEKTLEEPNA